MYNKCIILIIINLYFDRRFFKKELLFYIFVHKSEELDGPAVSALRCAIAEVKQGWADTGWVIKNLLSRVPLCFWRHVNPLVPAAFAVVSTHQPALGPRGGYDPSSLFLIHKEGLCPAMVTLIG
jgi:hypothetical protein